MERRLIIGPCRSGTTALLHAFSLHPEVEAVYQPIKSGLRVKGVLDHGFFMSEGESDKTFLIAKETIGHKTSQECQLDVFPNDAAIESTRPCFIIRNPIDTFSSWQKLGWGNEASFITSYQHTASLFERASSVSDQTSLIVQEEFILNPEGHIRRLCKKWGIDFVPELIQWPQRLSASSPIQRWIHSGSEKGFEAGHHQRLRESNGFEPMNTETTLTQDQVLKIQGELSIIYEKLLKSHQKI